MTPVEKKQVLEARRKKFGDLPDEVLSNMNDDGCLIYSVVNGKKVYGLPSGPRLPDSPPLICEYYSGPSMTQQNAHDEVSLKAILKRYGVYKNYIPEEVVHPIEFFRDVSNSPRDYLEAVRYFEEANEAFLALPAELRRAVGDSPKRLLELSQSKEGVEELKKLGFTEKEASPPKVQIEGFVEFLKKQELSKKAPVPAVAPPEA